MTPARPRSGVSRLSPVRPRPFDGSRGMSMIWTDVRNGKGANCGIGYETARNLLLANFHVILGTKKQAVHLRPLGHSIVSFVVWTPGCRSVMAGSIAANRLEEQTGNANVTVLELDLASLASIRKFCTAFRKLGLPLHVLISKCRCSACPGMRQAPLCQTTQA